MTFESVFKEKYSYVVKHIMQIVKNQEIAESLAQEVFVQLYKTNWEEIEYLKAWLIKSAIYVSYNYLRTEKRNQARLEKASTFIDSPDMQVLENEYIRKEQIKGVQSILDELGEKDKELLMLRYSGLKYKEIAEALEIEISAVGMRIARAQSRFKKMYMKKMEVEI